MFREWFTFTVLFLAINWITVVMLSNHKYTDTRQYFTMFHPLRFPDERRGRRTATLAEKRWEAAKRERRAQSPQETHWLAQVRVPELTLWPRYMRYHEIPLGSFKVSGILSFCSVSWNKGPPDSRSCTDCSCPICHHKHGGMLQNCVLRFFDASQDKADAKRKPCDKCSRRVDLWVSYRREIQPEHQASEGFQLFFSFEIFLVQLCPLSIDFLCKQCFNAMGHVDLFFPRLIRCRIDISQKWFMSWA